ncbi:MAG TPA: SagB family peptide dehydrogenase [Thermoanaerobaculia bacterium]|nr:SagB family peptide dehydrogenase [Thermoanaerobaculia bacterium]
MPARILLLHDDAGSGAAADGLTPGVRAALARLAGEGAPEDELEASVLETDGSTGLPLLHFALNRMARRGELSYRAAGDSGPLATATVTVPINLRETDPEAHYQLSRFALVRRIEERIVIETAMSPARMTIDDARVLQLVMALATPQRTEDLTSTLSHDEVSALCSLLLGCRMLAEANEDEGALAYWNFHDLLFHARTRFGRHQGRFGGSYPFRGRAEPLPVAKPAMSDDVVELDTPELGGDFTAILDGRHSSRDFGDPPLTRGQLGEFLYRSARIRDTYDFGGMEQQLSKRPYPGGGAVYELEIYVSVRACAGLAPGLYHYCPRSHRLARLGDSREALLRRATQPPHGAPQVLLTIAARFGRIFWKYESMGYALILKDVGALFQTMYLVAEAMGIGACAMGGGDSDLFAAAAGLDYYAETSVGEFIIGSRAKEDQR